MSSKLRQPLEHGTAGMLMNQQLFSMQDPHSKMIWDHALTDVTLRNQGPVEQGDNIWDNSLKVGFKQGYRPACSLS